jgi:hypothetical protein
MAVTISDEDFQFLLESMEFVMEPGHPDEDIVEIIQRENRCFTILKSYQEHHGQYTVDPSSQRP